MSRRQTEKLAAILESYWPKNKAKGLLAQTIFMDEIKSGQFGGDSLEKIVSGSWLIAPKGSDYYRQRFAFLVHPIVLASAEYTKSIKNVLEEKYRPVHAIADYLDNAGVGFMYVVPICKDGVLPVKEISERNFDNIKWKFFRYINKDFSHIDGIEFFSKWDGDRGRATFNNRMDWEQPIKDKVYALREDVLLELLLNELFMTGFVKSILHKPLTDPYDIDAFLMSLSQKFIFPMEIKQKTSFINGSEKYFGIDAGRVAMLLRLSLPNDANSIYLIRELDSESNFLGWKYITLSDIVMTSSWNLQAGGPGMGGQSTQTIKLPYKYFKDFDRSTLSEDNLSKIGHLPKDIKAMAKEFKEQLL